MPARALQELARVAGHAEDEQLADQRAPEPDPVRARAAIILSSRLIDGQFPNYRQLLPETFEHELRLAGRS